MEQPNHENKYSQDEILANNHGELSSYARLPSRPPTSFDLRAPLPNSTPISSSPPRREELELLKKSNHPSKSVRFVYEALRTVVQERTPIADWDDNHYTELAILAKSLDTKKTKLSALAYQPGSLLNRKQALIAAAIVAYMKLMEVKIKSAGDEDEEVGWGNDRALLVLALGMHLEKHPLFAEANCDYREPSSFVPDIHPLLLSC
ncbi:hypothetical protein BYT27DRAFT_7264505 [Phlegmacium glaucopus]|nr:hypothetical protein BYT27DRAFT_7264505 [Phlegmacium glaucopus]